MFQKYEVFYDGHSLGMVLALTEKSAIDKFYNQSIGCSAYSGKAYWRYKAVKI